MPSDWRQLNVSGAPCGLWVACQSNTTPTVSAASSAPAATWAASTAAANVLQPSSCAAPRPRVTSSAIRPAPASVAVNAVAPSSARFAGLPSWGLPPSRYRSTSHTPPAGTRPMLRTLAPRASRPPSPSSTACNERTTVMQRTPSAGPSTKAKSTPPTKCAELYGRIGRLNAWAAKTAAVRAPAVRARARSKPSFRSAARLTPTPAAAMPSATSPHSGVMAPFPKCIAWLLVLGVRRVIGGVFQVAMARAR